MGCVISNVNRSKPALHVCGNALYVATRCLRVAFVDCLSAGKLYNALLCMLGGQSIPSLLAPLVVSSLDSTPDQTI